MHFYIKEWPDQTVTFMVGVDQVLWTFHSMAEARQACRNYYDVRIHADQNPVTANTKCRVGATHQILGQ